MTFEEAFERLIDHEGGYVNHPNDPGGETKWGVTLRVARAEGYTGTMRALPREVAKEIYRRSYWLRSGADRYDPAIGFQVFDIAVNHGIGNAIRMLQRAVAVADDGIAGPVTIRGVKALSATDVLMLLNAERLEFYAKLTTFSSFGRGWTRRVANNLRYASEDA